MANLNLLFHLLIVALPGYVLVASLWPGEKAILPNVQTAVAILAFGQVLMALLW